MSSNPRSPLPICGSRHAARNAQSSAFANSAFKSQPLGSLVLSLLLAIAIAGCSLIPKSPSSTASPGAASPGTPGGVPPTATPAVPPTPTPVPIVRVSSGDKALFDGDLDTAMLQYRAA